MNEFWPVGCGGSSAPLNLVGSLIRQSFDHCIETLCQRYRVPSENIRVAFARHYRYIPLENQVLFPGVREACQSVLELGGMNTIVTHRSVASSRAQLREPADYQIAHYAVHFQPDPGAGLGSLAFAPVLDVLRNLERKSVLLEPKLGNRRSVFGLCARSGFTS